MTGVPSTPSPPALHLNMPTKSVQERYRILVVEDDPHIARLMLVNLSKMDLECRYVSDGAMALKAFEEINPHLILLDLALPGLNGQAVSVRIRQTSVVPIIVVTGQDEIESQVHLYKLGVDDYITKPFDTKLLMVRVMAQLRRCYRYISTTSAETTPSKMGLPMGWANCDSCNYMGPSMAFEKCDTQNHVMMVCPHCHTKTNVTFSVG